MPTICRDCYESFERPGRCPACRSPRTLSHPEILTLGIAHIDCDAFYASVEKRDDPTLADRPVIIGGGRRGVVSTACYVARIRGVRSAMPMFKALALCPEAVVIPPRMETYVAVSRQIRTLMEEATPLVEPLSLDEAFLDLRGTQRLHRAPPAITLARLIARIRSETGIDASAGLSHNKFLAKIASDLDKPRGYSVVGEAETDTFLAPRPVSTIWGVGAATQKKLIADGFRTIADLRRADEADLTARYGAMGRRLAALARGEDARLVTRNAAMKSISAETTFDEDIRDRETLEAHLWRLAVRVADRAKARTLAGRRVTVKVRTADFRALTRQSALTSPTQLADRIFTTGRALLGLILSQGPFRLVGVGISDLLPEGEGDDASADLLDSQAGARARAERASDRIRARFGADSIAKGRSIR
ncbi:DNA polymerase IV [Pikeienuella piscinae]|uniref:DNA polymerase IV n=1 Tax=Pikeienuella piscinae TaxID=2748098 RepID=A0A7M3T7K7_9RHOB|nr:DNA polymerase IV [Pikeienuella piscinae]QIE57988.1 DNA polymerase IV [Pikeienuella piscinae]